jgi:FAD/FMN-containing dehydrogenase
MEISLILANSTGIQVSRTDYPDLYWALRGGGGGNFGIVTEIQIRTFNITPYAYVQACWGDFREIPGILKTWGNVIRDPESELYQNFEIYRTYTQIRFCISVQGRNTTSELLNYLSPHFAGSPYDELFMTNITTLPLNIPNETFPTYYQYSKSIVLDPSAFGDASPFNSIMGNALNTLKDIQLLWLIYENFGKAANLPSSSDTSFPHRNMSGVLYLKALWPSEYDSQLGLAARSSANTLWNQLAPYDNGAYINYIDPELENWSGSYYANNYARLTNIKDNVDPTNFFSFSQSIGSQ